MLGSYRGIFVAIAGLALAGAGPPSDQPKDGKTAEQTAPPGTPSPDYTPYPGYHPDPCYQDKDHEAADLCAQWRAALAAEKAARLSNWGNWIAGAGAVLSFASVVLVLMALGQGREANRLNMREAGRNSRRAVTGSQDTKEALRIAAADASAAQKAARAAHESNVLAREAMHRQLRPHVYVVGVSAKFEARPFYIDPTSYFATCSVALRNFGQAPAKRVKGFARCFVGNMWNAPFDTDLTSAAEVPLANIPPTHEVPLEPYTTNIPVGDT